MTLKFFDNEPAVTVTLAERCSKALFFAMERLILAFPFPEAGFTVHHGCEVAITQSVFETILNEELDEFPAKLRSPAVDRDNSGTSSGADLLHEAMKRVSISTANQEVSCFVIFIIVQDFRLLDSLLCLVPYNIQCAKIDGPK